MLELWIERSVTRSTSCCLTCPGPPAATLAQVLAARPPVSAPPTGLDECFFFISLVVRLLYSSIFCQFWLFFVFKLVVVLLLVVRGGSVCLPMPPSWLEVVLIFFNSCRILYSVSTGLSNQSSTLGHLVSNILQLQKCYNE